MSEPRWQFSLRSLLILTTLVSICLAIGVHFAGFMVVVIGVGVMQVAMMLCADWLIRPSNRRTLAFVTAGSWMVMGSGSLIVCLALAFNALEEFVSINGNAVSKSLIPPSVLVSIIAVIAVLCYVTAAMRWRKLSAATNHEELSDALLRNFK